MADPKHQATGCSEVGQSPSVSGGSLPLVFHGKFSKDLFHPNAEREKFLNFKFLWDKRVALPALISSTELC